MPNSCSHKTECVCVLKHIEFVFACTTQFVEDDNGAVHISVKSKPLVICSAAGSGKTYLLRSWLESFQQSNPRDSVNLITIGETLLSCDYLAILRALGWALSKSVLRAARNISTKLAKEGLAPVGGAVGGPRSQPEAILSSTTKYT